MGTTWNTDSSVNTGLNLYTSVQVWFPVYRKVVPKIIWVITSPQIPLLGAGIMEFMKSHGIQDDGMQIIGDLGPTLILPQCLEEHWHKIATAISGGAMKAD